MQKRRRSHGDKGDSSVIREEIVKFYQKLYTESEIWRRQFNHRSGVVISEEDNLMLECQFSEAEIKECVMACARDKAPGPDGFTMAFFTNCWEIIHIRWHLLRARQIMDAIVIANECVDVRQISNAPSILCKLDIEKAYDHLNWGFLWKTLENMGFGERWMDQILHHYSEIFSFD
ncbi:hypothetical protein MTR67_039406 [Solanum verrucosum]|uniref:Reverse transcriptase domain-containing protein n=1 Tax=Solanum verrucosum TaxID=315347 RepID=A0AAF0ZNU5_SOLVR|nr:hypothetical protein MTR67_039406 [Solanum verrucosum]